MNRKSWLSLLITAALVFSGPTLTQVRAEGGGQVSEAAAEASSEKKEEDSSKDREEEKKEETSGEGKEEKKEEKHSVTGISVSKSSLTLEAGQSDTLSWEIHPSNADDKGVRIQSSDSGIAKADSSGKITGVAPGSASITVTSNDGGLSAACQVTVKAASSDSSGDRTSDGTGKTGNGKQTDEKNADGSVPVSGNPSGSSDSRTAAASQIKAKESQDDHAYTTSLADGSYTDFTFKWEGGTGKANLSLDKLLVIKGIAYGEFSASSANMTHVYYEGHTKSDSDDDSYYDPVSGTCGSSVLAIEKQKVRIPVYINKKTPISCRTTAMSVPHWIHYEYTITMTLPTSCKTRLAAEDQEENPVKANFQVADASGKAISAKEGAYVLEIGSSYQVTASAEGYQTWTGSISPAQDGETITLVLEEKSYAVTVRPIDQDNKEEVTNTSIKVTDEKNGEAVSVTGGKYIFKGPRTYTITVSSGDDYEDARKEHVKVAEDSTIDIPLKAVDESSLTKYKLTVKVAAEGGKVIEDAEVEVVRETSKETTSIKPSGGRYSLISGKNYTVTVSAQGYESASRVVQLTSDSEENFSLKKKSYPLHVRVIDQENEYNLSKAAVTVKDEQGKIYKGEDGSYSIPYETRVSVSASCAGYEPADGSAAAVETIKVTGEKTVTLRFIRKTYAVKISVVDSSTGKAVSGARLVVTSSDTNQTVNPSGNSYPMKYSTIYTIEASASGYASASMTHKAVSEADVTLKLSPTSESSSSGTSSGTKNTEQVVNNGTYNIKYKDAENSMFNVVGAVLHVKDGKYTADISLSGTGYDYVYPSTAAAAIKAGKSKWSKYWKNGKGLYTYTIEVPYLDKPFILASRSIKYAKDPAMKDQAWRDGLESGGSHGSHEIILYSKYTNGKSLPTHAGTKKASSIPAATDKSSGKTTTSSSKKKTDKSGSSGYSSNTNGGTSSVNNNTGLKDGTYKPDNFSFSGGTGKVQITCDQVIIKGGKTYAKITFSSTYFQYVKAGGQKITNYTRTSSSTSFVIPVELNKNNKILGMTTKMSQPHEIAYTIYVGLNAAKTAGSSTAAGTSADAGSVAAAGQTKGNVNDQYKVLDAQAPEIIGLTYQDELPVVYSDKIKIYRYQDGYSLIELDVRKGTALDESITGIAVSTAEEDSKETSGSDSEAKGNKEGKDSAAEEKTSESPKASSGQTGEDEESQASDAKTASELKAALYDNPIYKYLLVPENGTIPAGIDKQLFVIQLPVSRTAVTSCPALELLDVFNLNGFVTAIGVPEEDITVDAFKEALKNDNENGIKKIGSYDDLDYKTLLLDKTNLLLESSDILPQLGEAEGFPQKTPEEFAGLTDQEKDNFRKLATDQAMALKKIGMRGVQISMAVIVDRSADEPNDLAKAEWLKLYGLLYNKSQEADSMYKGIVDKASDEEKKNAAIAPTDSKSSQSSQARQ